MPCVTVFVPGLKTSTFTIGKIEEAVRDAGVSVEGLNLKYDDIWPYVVPLPHAGAPAIKVNVEVLDKPERTPPVLQEFALRLKENILAATIGFEGVPKALVVYTTRQNPEDGFAEQEPAPQT